MSKLIPLHGMYAQGRSAVVDDENFAALSAHRWYASKHGHAMTTALDPRSGKRRTIYMHRIILAPGGSLHVDHVNGNPLDNRLENLRPCTPRQNQRNARPRRGTSSRFKGVHLDSWTGRWRAEIKVDGKRRCLGRYDSEREAAEAYDLAALEHFGEFARPNLTTR